MKRLNWIHLTDLHYGADVSEWLWNDVRDSLEADFDYIAREMGRLDVLFFTGDLTFSGKKEQFEGVNRDLKKVLDRFENRLGKRPILLCVPGNHDLQRPPENEPESELLNHFYHDAGRPYRENFWAKDNDRYRTFVINTFNEYSLWWKDLKEKQKDRITITDGVMPGDFSAVLQTEDMQVGVIGLNSAFLQLSDQENYNHLDLHESQIGRVCAPDYPTWAKKNDINILITHHGINSFGEQFFHPEAMERYKGTIYNPSRIYCHLYGHMHRPFGEDVDFFGGGKRRYRIAPSLFGLKMIQGGKAERIHGYTAGQITINRDQITETLWPRIAVKRDDVYCFAPDTSYPLEAGREYVVNTEISATKVSSSELDPEYEDDLKRCRRDMVGEEVSRRITLIEGDVINLWNRHQGPPWNNLHNASHNRKVENSLYQLITKAKASRLKPDEWFCLLAAVWLHEIGMILGLFDDDDQEKIVDGEPFPVHVRKQHHERCVRLLYEEPSSFRNRFESKELEVISEICRFHRKSSDISKCEKNIAGIRVDLLASYLRLALAIHIDEPPSEDEYYLLLKTMAATWEDLFHWQKGNWIKEIRALPEDLSIEILYYSLPEKSPASAFMPKEVVNEIKTLNTKIQEILIRGKISNFLDVKPIRTGNLSKAAIRDMELIHSNSRIEELSSASEAYETVLESILRFTSYTLPFSLIQRYIEGIEKLLIQRPCHNLMRNFIHEIKEMMVKSTDEVKEIDRIKNKVTKIIEERKRIKEKISQNSRPFLTDYGSIFLFGYSSTVMDTLMDLAEDVMENTTVYIGECRGKSQFDDNNQILYNDGLNYARKVKDIGFKNVHVVPDISIGNLMKRKKIQKIFFGANGIDNEHGSFGHTCGHLAIADLAKEYNVPVYVVADSDKFGPLKWDQDLDRKIVWLANDPKWAEDVKAVGNVNPREDQVEPSKIKMLITEIGAFPPERIPGFIKKKNNEDKQKEIPA